MMPYLLIVRKVKDRGAVALARKRWAGTTKDERLAASRIATEARSRKAAERRAAREAQAIEPEMMEA
jgi:hypothetical protein